MKSKLIYSFILISTFSYAQWNSSNGDIYFDAGKVAIGTSIPNGGPNALLTLFGDIQFDSNASRRIDVGGTTGTLLLGGSGQLSLRTYLNGWKDRLYINNTGNIGVNNNNPLYQLDVDGNINISAGSNFLIDGTPLNLGSVWQTSGQDTYFNTGKVAIGTNTPNGDPNALLTLNGDIQFDSNASRRIDVGGTSGTLNLGGSGQISLRTYSSGWSERMFIENSGDVGINTNSPRAKLEVNGNLLISENHCLILHSPNGTPFEIKVDDNGNLYTSQTTLSNSIIDTNIEIKIFPNPSTNLLKIQSDLIDISRYFIEIIDINGKLLYQGVLNSKNTSIDVSEFNIGLYIVRLKNPNGKMVKSYKLIKE